MTLPSLHPMDASAAAPELAVFLADRDFVAVPLTIDAVGHFEVAPQVIDHARDALPAPRHAVGG